MNRNGTARWSWTVDANAVHKLRDCFDPALQDALVGWPGLPEGLPKNLLDLAAAGSMTAGEA